MNARIGVTPLARGFNGAHLRKVRVFDRGYTLKELAGKCGCSEQAISQYERGKRSMDVYTCKRILNALQCTPHDVLCKDDQATMIAEFSEYAFAYIGAEHTSGASVNTSRTMGKTPEEIKKSLKYCSSHSYCSDDCPHYTDARCTLLADALVLVQQLEAREWDLLDLLSSAWFGKRCYFKQDNGTIYSRVSGEYMTLDQAIDEFAGELTNERESDPEPPKEG